MMSGKAFFFKSFEIHQENSRLKLGTDAVLLGSWAMYEQPLSILDLGTGCGVIALMLAQRYPQAMVTGVDVQLGCIKDAELNFRLSPWKWNLKAVHADVLEFGEEGSFDLIVSNPPYFDGTYLSGETNKDIARHAGELNLKSLISKAAKLLKTNGSLQLVLPYNMLKDANWESSLQEMYPVRECKVFTRKNAEAERVLVEYRKNIEQECVRTELYIRDSGTAKQNLEFQKTVEQYYVFM